MLPFTLGRALIASVILGLVSVYAIVFTDQAGPEATMHISPERKLLSPEETLTVTIDVESLVPVNAFTGTLVYDPAVFSVREINYNTSIADLWVEEPWFSAGDGTITFAGGTTDPGGFTGTGTLLTITFSPLKETSSELALSNAHIYEHDGFGSEADIDTPIDALFTIAALEEQARTSAGTQSSSLSVTVLPTSTSFDLNADERVTFSDVSIFMLNIFGSDTRYDFNQDGLIDRTDLSLLLEARD